MLVEEEVSQLVAVVVGEGVQSGWYGRGFKLYFTRAGGLPQFLEEPDFDRCHAFLAPEFTGGGVASRVKGVAVLGEGFCTCVRLC